METMPRKIGRYEIRSQLGKGGMAVVYLGYDPLTSREVAIKVLPSELSASDPQFQLRFQDEIRISANLEHPSIVPIYDVGDENGQPYLIMKNMRGGTLAKKIENGPLSIKESVRILEHIAPALDEAHSKKVVHRDIKPSNILFDNYDHPSISDFGIAKVLETQTTNSGKTGFIGTLAYMSPEQAQEHSVDGRADIYSLGVIFYEMLSGKQPHDVITRISYSETEPYPRILEINKNLPPWVEPIISKAMSLEKNERFATASEMLDAIKTHIFNDTPAPVSPVPLPRLSKLLMIAGAVVLFFAAGAFLFRDVFLPAPLPTPTLTIRSTATHALTATKPPTKTLLPSETPVSTSVDEPTVTVPSLPVLGGADKVAFLRDGNIWIMNVDGSELRSLTNDKTEKFNLEWTPDGKSVIYITTNKALKAVNIETNKVDDITGFGGANYFEAFRISPDGKQVAISLNRQLHVVPFDLEKFRGAVDRDDLLAMDGCLYYTGQEVEEVLWANNGRELAIKFAASSEGPIADNIRVIDISHCRSSTPVRLFEFPKPHFAFSRTIVSFDWDGESLFLLNDDKRNKGFGNLGVYNTDTYLFKWLAPIDNVCCYRDAAFSPDGTYVLFTFQDIRLGEKYRIDLYYVEFGLLEIDARFEPIPLPTDFFTNRDESPSPALRPAQK